MEMNFDYFQDSLKIIKYEIERGNPSGAIWILEQIARDARLWQAERDRGAVRRLFKTYITLNEKKGKWYIGRDAALAALDAEKEAIK
jgi:hypothetical protein